MMPKRFADGIAIQSVDVYLDGKREKLGELAGVSYAANVITATAITPVEGVKGRLYAAMLTRRTLKFEIVTAGGQKHTARARCKSAAPTSIEDSVAQGIFAFVIR
jgi:hypothetical protein